MKDIVKKIPQQKRSREKYNAILQACPRVLAEFGYEKSTTERIATEAEVSIGTLYDYFPNKESIFICYLDTELDNALAVVCEKMVHSIRIEKQLLKELITVGIDFAYQQRDIFKVLFFEMPQSIERVDLVLSKARIQSIILDFARSQSPDSSSHEIERLLYTMTNTIIGFQFRIALVPPEGISLEEQIDDLTDILFTYMKLFVQ